MTELELADNNLKYSSVGRATALYAVVRGFDSHYYI